MIVNQAALNGVQTGFNTAFRKRYAAATPMWSSFSMKTKSTAAVEEYPFYDDIGLMKEWAGERPQEQLVAYLYSLTNRKFSRSVAVRVEDIERDRLSLMPIKAADIGQAAAEWPDQLVGTQFQEAFDGGDDGKNLCYDGQFFCDTDHPVYLPGGDIGTESNKITAALDFSTKAAASASFGAAKALMTGRKDKDGNPMHIKPRLLVVGTNLDDEARSGMTNDRLEDGTNNIYKGAAEVKVFDWLPDNYWFLLDNSRPLQPFIFQEEKPPVQDPTPTMQSDQVRKKGLADFGIQARGVGGYGEWRFAVGSDGTT